MCDAQFTKAIYKANLQDARAIARAKETLKQTRAYILGALLWKLKYKVAQESPSPR